MLTQPQCLSSLRNLASLNWLPASWSTKQSGLKQNVAGNETLRLNWWQQIVSGPKRRRKDRGEKVVTAGMWRGAWVLKHRSLGHTISTSPSRLLTQGKVRPWITHCVFPNVGLSKETEEEGVLTSSNNNHQGCLSAVKKGRVITWKAET